MIKTQPGERLQIEAAAEFRIHIGGAHADRIAVVAVSTAGTVEALEQTGPADWQLRATDPLGDTFELVAYIVDDRCGGFVNDSYPIEVEIAGNRYAFPAPSDQLAAVIVAEVYVRNGVRRLKVSNEGFTFGIDAYARARNLSNVQMPRRHGPASGDAGSGNGRPRPQPGQPIASGSGVLVAPGIVATNAHVIEDGSIFKIGRGNNGLNPISVDQMHDLALLQGDVAGEPLPLRFGSPVWLGEGVLAAGYPLMDLLGADLKVSTGNVSGLTGGQSDISRFQFTAPIGSGSSGGAIVDEHGNLVGITSASLAHGNLRDRGSISENVNFAIKVSLVLEMLAAAGVDLPEAGRSQENNRRDVVQRLRRAVVSIIVEA